MPKPRAGRFSGYAFCWLLPLAAFAGAGRAVADFQGAEAALAKADAIALAQARTTEDPWPKALREFSAEAATLPPEEAARRWLELFDQAAARDDAARRPPNPPPSGATGGLVIPPPPAQDTPPAGSPAAIPEVFALLPPPAAWASLAASIQARPESGHPPRETLLRAFAAMLLNRYDEAQQIVAAAADRDDALDSPPDEYQIPRWDRLLDDLAKFAGQPPRFPARRFERQFRLHLANPAVVRLEVPDLVANLGEKKAAEYLRRLLLAEPADGLLTFSGKNLTYALAQRLALELVNHLKVPLWGFAADIDAGPFYAALAKRFPSKSGPPHYAMLYHLLDLIRLDRTQEANTLAVQFTWADTVHGSHSSKSWMPPGDGVQAMEAAGAGDKLVAFLDQLLRAHPDLYFWDDYAGLAKARHRTDLLRLRDQELARTAQVGSWNQTHATLNLAQADFAAGQVDEGAERLRAFIRRGLETKTIWTNDLTEAAISLIDLGRLLSRPPLVEEGISLAEQCLAPPAEYRSPEPTRWQYADALARAGRPERAEQMIAEQLAVRLIQSGYFGSDGPRNESAVPGQPFFLAEWMKLYLGAHRPADALALLDRAPYWGAADLGELLEPHGSPNVGEFTAVRPIFYAARALQDAGQPGPARRLIDAFLDRTACGASFDPAYALLLELDRGGDYIPKRLDELSARDPLESRPLIWKARWLLGKGQLDAAEQAVRQAIRLAPGDWQQYGPGDRMRAYAVLADILTAKGDRAQADSAARLVRATRESEAAQDCSEHGLTARAIELYQHALETYEGACFIHGALALLLDAQGKVEEAQKHFVRYCELLPASVGRVEKEEASPDGWFRVAWAPAAERVFARLAAERPDWPQAQFFLGFACARQQRGEEAFQHYREAVRLDPDYFQAWAELAASPLTAERDAALLNILRLDPNSRHVSAGWAEGVANLAALWQAGEAATRRRLPPWPASTELYPLKASREALAARPRPTPDWESHNSARPMDLLQNQTVVAAIIKLLGDPVMGGN